MMPPYYERPPITENYMHSKLPIPAMSYQDNYPPVY